MPQTPEERRKTFEVLAQKRQELLARERERMQERERVSTEQTQRQKAASLEEQQRFEERGEAREEWRQEQHTKKEELLADARKAAEERARQAEKAAKEAEEDAERTKKMRDLHERAVAQKTVSRKLQAKHIEEDTAKHVNDQLERDLRDAEHMLERTLRFLVQDRRKKIARLEDDEHKQEMAATQRFQTRKKDAEMTGGARAGGMVLQVTAEHKRALMALQDRVLEARTKIESEYTRLKDEAVAQADQKKARLRAAADQRLREAQVRHENADEWIDAHRGIK